MLTKIQTLVLIALVVSILPTASAAREMLRGHGEPDASATTARPGDLPPDSRLEELIREVYGTYESTVVKSGHDLEFRLRDFRTILRHEFDEHEWLDLMTPYSGMRILQTRSYYDADWLRAGEVVHYDLRWQAASEQDEKVVTETKEFLAGTSISRTLQLQHTLWDRTLRPLGVLFDIEPGGAIEQVAWTVPQSADGFPALDRNGNGIIDDGSELFGNNTPQPPSADPNGFRALAVFDRLDQGGDSDGWLTERDAVFSQLRLWRDADHDGLSEDDELFPLSVAGIKAIELSYVESRRRDRHGNQFRYKSRVRLRRSTTQAFDIFLLSSSSGAG